MKKGTWHQCPIHASRAGKLGAAKSPWRTNPAVLSPRKAAKRKAAEKRGQAK